ncbi:MAG TPA: hypothetical protein VK674_00290 [Candidatus Limnocylindria bacterium]|nr:hypothetical protein [Candidatus Limnocylindria bacterium]
MNAPTGEGQPGHNSADSPGNPSIVVIDGVIAGGNRILLTPQEEAAVGRLRAGAQAATEAIPGIVEAALAPLTGIARNVGDIASKGARIRIENPDGTRVHNTGIIATGDVNIGSRRPGDRAADTAAEETVVQEGTPVIAEGDVRVVPARGEPGQPAPDTRSTPPSRHKPYTPTYTPEKVAKLDAQKAAADAFNASVALNDELFGRQEIAAKQSGGRTIRRVSAAEGSRQPGQQDAAVQAALADIVGGIEVSRPGQPGGVKYVRRNR